MTLKHLILLASLHLFCMPAIAAPWTQNLYFENDLFADTDQSYTNGIRLAWVSPDIDTYLYDPALPAWLREVNYWFTPLYPQPENNKDDIHRNLVFTIGQQMYTPEDKERVTLDPNDRPYAGWLYAGFGYHAKTKNKLNSVELNLGVVGPAALAEDAQNLIHRARGIELFQGWENQLQNELGLQLVWEYKHRIAKQPLFGRFGYDVITHYGGSFGNVAIYANSGAEIRFGFHLPDDFGTSALRPGGDNSAPGNADPRLRQGWGVHTFISIDGRLVARNIFLDGNTFQSSHSVDKKYVVADAAFGIAGVYNKWKVSYAQVYRTKEFEAQKDAQSYGSFSVSYSY
jgi:lipid A 3-O-deacylase